MTGWSSFFDRILRAKRENLKNNAVKSASQAWRDALRRGRGFETLEEREMLDAAGFNALPEVITIANPDSYHYAIVGADCGMFDSGDIEGLNASILSGTQVAFSVEKTSATDGAVSTLGEVVIQLFDQEAPNSSQHLLDVINSGYYEGKSIHRIIAGFMFQGGSEDGAGHGGSGWSIPDEYSPLLTFSRAGTIAYANSGSNTSDSQFFVTFGEYGAGNGSYNIFGYVVDGYDVVDELQAAEVVNNGWENSKPVDSYTISNFRVLDSSEKTHSVLRLMSEADAQGKTTLSYVSPELDEAQETTVYVGADGLHEYIVDALSEPVTETYQQKDGSELEITYNSFACVAGDTLYGFLPSRFADNAVTYTIAVNEDANGVTVTPLNDSSSIFSITTTETEPQKATLTITAETVYTSGYQRIGYQTYRLTDKLTTTITQDVFITPVAPTEVTFASEEAFQADGRWIVQSDFVDPKISLKITTSETEDATPNMDQQPFVVQIQPIQADGQPGAATDVGYTLDARDNAEGNERTITLNLDDALAEGDYRVSVRRWLKVDEGLVSEPTTLDFTVETSGLTLDEAGEASSAFLALQEGVDGSLQLKTNRVDSEGNQRVGVKYELVPNAANPTCLSVSESGLVTWTSPTAGQATITITATDEGGKSASKDFTVYVEGKPVFATESPLAPDAVAFAHDPTTDVLTLSWTDRATNEKGYLIRFYGENGSFSSKVKTAANATSVVFDLANTPTVESGTLYATIWAYNESGRSAAVRAQYEYQAPLRAPVAPGALRFRYDSDAELLKLSWLDLSTTEDGYRIEFSRDAVSWSTLATLNADAQSGAVPLENSPQGTLYYRVVAFNSVGDSAPSERAFETGPFTPLEEITIEEGEAFTLSVDADASDAVFWDFGDGVWRETDAVCVVDPSELALEPGRTTLKCKTIAAVDSDAPLATTGATALDETLYSLELNVRETTPSITAEPVAIANDCAAIYRIETNFAGRVVPRDWRIDWGDGTSTLYANQSAFTAGHVYATPNEAATRNIVVSLLDATGAERFSARIANADAEPIADVDRLLAAVPQFLVVANAILEQDAEPTIPAAFETYEDDPVDVNCNAALPESESIILPPARAFVALAQEDDWTIDESLDVVWDTLL